MKNGLCQVRAVKVKTAKKNMDESFRRTVPDRIRNYPRIRSFLDEIDKTAIISKKVLHKPIWQVQNVKQCAAKKESRETESYTWSSGMVA